MYKSNTKLHGGSIQGQLAMRLIFTGTAIPTRSAVDTDRESRRRYIPNSCSAVSTSWRADGADQNRLQYVGHVRHKPADHSAHPVQIRRTMNRRAEVRAAGAIFLPTLQPLAAVRRISFTTLRTSSSKSWSSMNRSTGISGARVEHVAIPPWERITVTRILIRRHPAGASLNTLQIGAVRPVSPPRHAPIFARHPVTPRGSGNYRRNRRFPGRNSFAGASDWP